MLIFFDDDSFPKMRRSLLITCGAIIFICHVNVGLKLPTALFDIPADTVVIEPRTAVLVLWVICAYLFLRFLSNWYALHARYRAGIDRETDVKKEAEHYLGQFYQHSVEVTGKLNQINEVHAKLENMKEGLDLLTQRLAHISKEIDYFISEAKKFPGPPGLEKKNTPENEQLNYQQAAERIRKEAERGISDLRQQLSQLGSVDLGFKNLDELKSRKEITHYTQKRSVEASSETILGADQYYFSLVSVIAALIWSATSTYHFFQ